MASAKSLLVAIAVLLAVSAVRAADTSACYTTPSNADCKSLLLSTSTLWKDLNSTCEGAAATGWPSACSLRAACLSYEAGANCNPLSILMAACDEDSSLPNCSKYQGLCASGSVVPACTGMTAIASLSNATTYFSDVQTLCGEMTMTGCSDCTGSASAAASSLATSCPNPLGTLSKLCLEMSMDGCAGWDALCEANSGTFPSLCGTSSSPMAMSPSPAGASPSPMAMSPSPPPSAGTPSSWAVGGCYSDPTQASCANFVQNATVTKQNITTLCNAMPFMSGCTLRDQCNAGKASGEYCDDFSILADICVDMPKMWGCEGYVALCKTTGTAVKQCTNPGAVPSLVMTYDAMNDVIDSCNEMPMDGCSDCTSTSNCPNPILTLAQVCQGMPDMSQCTGYSAMCSSAAGSTFTSLCTDASGSSLPPMRMYMHTAWTEVILFKGWVPTNKGEYIASCLAMIAGAILVQFLKSLRLRVEARWAAEMRVSCAAPEAAPGKQLVVDEGCPGCAGPPPPPGLWSGWVATSWPQARRNAVRSAFTGIVVFLDYMLMLVVMTFNVGLIVSTTLGFMLGALLFGHIGEAGGRAVAAPAIAPDNDADLEVQFVEPGSCCGNRNLS